MNKNDIVRVNITSLTGQGDGIAKNSDGITLFIPNSAIGDVLDVKILKVKKNYAYAKIEKIINPSENRISCDCECATKCGGCVFRHISYDSELKIKKQTVIDALNRIAGLADVSVENIVGASSITRYRNKAILPVAINKDEKIEVGFFAKNTHRVVSFEDCLLHPQIFNKVIDVLKFWIDKYNISVYDEKTMQGIVRNLYIRIAESTGEIMVCIVINSNSLPCEKEFLALLLESVDEVKSVIINFNKQNTNVVLGKNSKLIYGNNYITDSLCGLSFDISLHSFYQVNRNQTEKLYSIVRECASLSKNDTVLDLYCGIGTIGLSLARNVKKVIGVEIVKEAIQNARQNALKNNITNAEFILADAALAVKEVERRKEKIDVIILDPPRKGCSVDVIEAVIDFDPQKIVYVSCNPATLARDLKIFDQKNYKVKKVVPVDMFPRTGHVETVVLMTRTRAVSTV